MKKTRKIIFVVFILIAIAAMFLPVATFNDNSSASMAADIEKQQGKVDSAQTQLDRWIAGGKKSEADIQKQRDKVAKEKEKLDALLAEQAAASSEKGAGLSYAFLPGQLPSELEIDMQVVNQYKLYNWNFPVYYGCIWAAFAAFVIALVLVLAAGNKDASVLYTISSICHLVGIILAFYAILRLAAFPIKLPYGNAELKAPVIALLMGGDLLPRAFLPGTVSFFLYRLTNLRRKGTSSAIASAARSISSIVFITDRLRRMELSISEAGVPIAARVSDGRGWLEEQALPEDT